MINIKNSKELHIKRANTDWWISEKAIVADNGLTYIAYVTDMGEIHIKELDAKCSKTPSRDYRVCKLNCDFADEHNAPSICIFEDGRIMIAYTGHYVQGVRYRITAKPYDISSFGEECVLDYEGSVTYVQLFENTIKKELWLFTRVNNVNWRFRYSKDGGKTWSKPKTFLHSEAGGLFYISIRKQNIVTSKGTDEQWFFALYGHPLVSKDHIIRSAIFSSDGQLLKNDRSSLELNLYEGDSLMNLEELDIVYSSPAGSTVRLLDVSPTLPLRVGFATFVIDDIRKPNPHIPVYYSATFKNDKWSVSKPICSAGEFLAQDVDDGAQTYLGGMAYYSWFTVTVKFNRVHEGDIEFTELLTKNADTCEFDNETNTINVTYSGESVAVAPMVVNGTRVYLEGGIATTVDGVKGVAVKAENGAEQTAKITLKIGNDTTEYTVNFSYIG